MAFIDYLQSHKILRYLDFIRILGGYKILAYLLCFLIVRNVEAATFTRKLVPSSSFMRIERKFGKLRFFVLLFAWLTLFPTIGPLPVKKHFRAIVSPLIYLK